jgi:peroxiredoxin
VRTVFTSFILVAALCIGACHPAATDPSSEPIDTVTAAVAPDFALRDMNGITHHLSDYRGKVVVLSFWATWCPPCKKEIPDFVSLQQQDSLRGLQLLGIALDDEGIVKVKPWVDAHSLNYPTLLPDTAVCKNYGGINSIPTTFFIDRKGRLRNTAIGMRQRSILDSIINPLLNER